MGNRKPLPEPAEIRLPCLVQGEYVRLVDCNGAFLTGRIPLRLLTEEFDKELFESLLWKIVSKRLANTFHFSKMSNDIKDNNWLYKCQCMIASLRLRRLDESRIRIRDQSKKRWRHSLHHTKDVASVEQ